jgi:hypothetical protein
VTVLPDDSVLIWGLFTVLEGFPTAGVGRLLPGLRPDKSFRSGLTPGVAVTVAEMQPDGKVIAFCRLPVPSKRPPRYRLVRLNDDGSLDAQFRSDVSFDGEVTRIRLDSQGRIILVGAFRRVAGRHRGKVARLLPDGSFDATFDVGDGPDQPVGDLFVQPDDSVVLQGDFRYFNSEECWGLVKLHGGPTLSKSPEILGISAPRSVQAGGTISLGAVVAGERPAQFQWFHGGNPLPGETNATLVVRDARIGDRGTYRLTVENRHGATEANTALTIMPRAVEPPMLSFSPAQAPRVVGAPLLLGLTGEPGRVYRLQVSTNLETWKVAAGRYAPNRIIEVSDPYGAAAGPRFVTVIQN